jgi:hypothetical protein
VANVNGVRELATSWAGTRIAAAQFEHRVAIIDVEQLASIAEFDTVMDAGGERLSIDARGDVCVAGAYEARGIAAYDVRSGGLRWQRKDLTKVQDLRISPDGDTVFCVFERGPAHALSAADGRTQRTIRGARLIRQSPFDGTVFIDATRRSAFVTSRFEPLSHPEGERDWFGILDSAFSPTSFCASLAGGPTRCWEVTTGRLLWTYTPRSGRHLLNVGYCEPVGAFFGIEWPYAQGGNKQVIRLADDGSAECVADLEVPCAHVFCRRGTRVVLSNGRVVDIPSGTVTSSLKRLLAE